LFDYGTLSVVLAARPFGDALMVAVSLALAVETPPCVMLPRCAANPKESLHGEPVVDESSHIGQLRTREPAAYGRVGQIETIREYGLKQC